MMGFCRSTFFKRIDSSGFAFLLTIYRHILRNAIFIYAIDNKLPLPIGDENALPDDYMEDEDGTDGFFANTDEEERQDGDGQQIAIPTDFDYYMEKAKECYSIIENRNACSWISSKYFKRTLKQQLRHDCEVLLKMIALCGVWQPDADPKLNELEALLDGSHGADKVIVFTQFSTRHIMSINS